MATGGKRNLSSTGGSTPPSKKDKASESCVSCKKKISDNSSSLLCEFCCEWEHRSCSGVSSEAYNVLSDDPCPNIMFFCSLCRPKVTLALKFFNEIQEKQNELETRLTEMEKQLEQSQQTPSSVSAEPTTYGSAQPTATNEPIAKDLKDKDQADRKFNIVIYGISECSKGTPRHERLKHDLDKVTQIVAEGENSISPLSIRDLFRLGKYCDQLSKPRPILVRLTRTIDVSLLLSKARTLPKEIRIKPSMTREERLTESLLLKERWSLIQSSSFERKAIKIGQNKIYVHNKLHGQIINSTFVPAQSKSSVTDMEASTT